MNQKEYEEVVEIIKNRRAVWESRYRRAKRHGDEALAKETAARIDAAHKIITDIRRAFNSEAGL